MGRTVNLLAISSLLALAAASPASTYFQDDGTAESTTIGARHQVLAAGYQVMANFETIVNMEFYNVWDLANGHAITYHLWTDPTNDGIIGDAVLQQSVPTTIQSAPNGSWQTVNFAPQQLAVGSWFYVGISFDDLAISYFLGGNDTSGQFTGHSYTIDWQAGTNPSQLGTGTLWPNGGTNLMIRANAVPEPGTCVALSIGAAALLRRRRALRLKP